MVEESLEDGEMPSGGARAEFCANLSWIGLVFLLIYAPYVFTHFEPRSDEDAWKLFGLFLARNSAIALVLWISRVGMKSADLSSIAASLCFVFAATLALGIIGESVIVYVVYFINR